MQSRVIFSFDATSPFLILFEIQRNILYNETLFRAVNPIIEGTSVAIGDANLFLFCITPLIPAVFLAIAVSGGLVLDLLEMLSSGAISRRIAGAGARQGGIFQTAAILVSIIGATAAVVLPLVTRNA